MNWRWRVGSCCLLWLVLPVLLVPTVLELRPRVLALVPVSMPTLASFSERRRTSLTPACPSAPCQLPTVLPSIFPSLQ